MDSNSQINQTIPVVANQQAQPPSSSSSYQRNKQQRFNNAKSQGPRGYRSANEAGYRRNDSGASSSSSSSQQTLKGDTENGLSARDNQTVEESQTDLTSLTSSHSATEPQTFSNKKKKQPNINGKPQGKANNYGGSGHRGYPNKANRYNSIDSESMSTSSSNGYRGGSGPKKTNLNHLLNFTYESMRDSNENYYEYERMTRQFWSMKLAKNSYFSKEQFLQANCQFVVKSSGDYSVHLSDPDLLVDWEKIEEIHISSHESIVCPICLYPPQAGKMTKCGHVYCWSCILHYLALSDKSWRKCPICFESIYKNDLKSLKVIEQPNEFKLGDEISFNLMFKSKQKYNSLILPVSVHDQFQKDEKHFQQSHPSSPSVNFKMFNKAEYNDCLQYIKLHSKGNKDIYEQIVKREREELNQQIENEKNQPEVCFVNEALELLLEREKNLNIQLSGKSESEMVSVKKEEPAPPAKTEPLTVPTTNPNVKYDDAFDDKAKEALEPSSEQELSSSPDSTSSPPESPLARETPKPNLAPKASEVAETIKNNETHGFNSIHVSTGPNDYSYFYQSTDGQRIYISALNARCLIHEYSSFAHCPLRITGKIVACDSFFMSEENRKRYKYLSHLPLHSEFKVVELDLKEPYLSQKTLEAFRSEIEERRQMRARKEIREKRLADKMAAATAIEPSYWVPSAANEIIFSRNEAENLIDYSNEFPEASTSPTLSSNISISGNSYNSNGDHQSAQQQAISFAQMLKHRNMAVSGDPSKRGPAGKGIQELDMWPSLDSNTPPSSASSSSTTNPLLNLNQTNSTQLTSGWLTLVKNQEQTLGRAKKYQEAPKAWGLASKNETLTSIVDKLEEERQQGESEDDSMPAPLYQASFFSAIDASLKSIESRKQQSSNPFDVNESSQQELNGTSNDQKQPASTASKKKKKTKQLLFSTSLNMGV